MILLTEKQIFSFWGNVNIGNPDVCWEWQGSIFWKSNNEIRYQYGRFYANGKAYRAHKVSYWLHHGLIPNGFLVRHKCNNPRCVNPHHLELGSHYDNTMDRVKSKRTRNQYTGRINNDELCQRTS